MLRSLNTGSYGPRLKQRRQPHRGFTFFPRGVRGDWNGPPERLGNSDGQPENVRPAGLEPSRQALSGAAMMTDARSNSPMSAGVGCPRCPASSHIIEILASALLFSPERWRPIPSRSLRLNYSRRSKGCPGPSAPGPMAVNTAKLVASWTKR
ncbi:uncharacterized protein BJX67DRAFT_166217 [Aspergillus lucknowensis]|uniref:Uncharacterized protein n=1 Tax=Aspergillus lucknowensis TaxID=176173 RepID=A0ABR4M4P7_9EURO